MDGRKGAGDNREWRDNAETMRTRGRDIVPRMLLCISIALAQRTSYIQSTALSPLMLRIADHKFDFHRLFMSFLTVIKMIHSYILYTKMNIA
jgi:hypothetical protein